MQLSVPYRVDLCAGADLREVAIPFESYRPCAFNFTIPKYVHVRISEYTKGYILVDGHEYHIDSADMMNRYDRLAVYVCMSLGVSGVALDITSDLEYCSGLGGSSATMVALIQAVCEYTNMSVNNAVLEWTHQIENSILGMNTGIQDQGAAVFGGVSLWNIHYRGQYTTFPTPDSSTLYASTMYDRIYPEDMDGVLDYIRGASLLVYTNKQHDSAAENDAQIRAYLNPATRSTWLSIFDLTREFYDAVVRMDTQECIRIMNEVLDIKRGQLTITADMAHIIALADGCGVSICGAGGGGYMWILSDDISSTVEVLSDYSIIQLGMV